MGMRELFSLVRRDYEEDAPLFIRPSARLIVIKDNRVLMVYSQRDDYYKFPGGGIEEGEDPLSALFREAEEEAGIKVNEASIREYGNVHREEKGEHGDHFIQENYYYFGEIAERTQQHLDRYEAEEGFTPVWADPREVIETNLKNASGNKEPVMLIREAKVLQLLITEGCLK